MPGYKNRFRSPEFIEQTIMDENREVVGTIRIKPSSVLWKPKGAYSFYAVKLGEFTSWITSPESGAKVVKK